MFEPNMRFFEDEKTAIIKAIVEQGSCKWYIYAPDGRRIAMAENHEQAVLLVKQFNLIPATLH